MRSVLSSRRVRSVLVGSVVAAATVVGVTAPAGAAPAARQTTALIITEGVPVAPTTYDLHGHLEVQSSGAVVKNAVIEVERNGTLVKGKSATTNNSGNVVIPVTVAAGDTVHFNLFFPGNNSFVSTTSMQFTITNP